MNRRCLVTVCEASARTSPAAAKDRLIGSARARAASNPTDLRPAPEASRLYGSVTGIWGMSVSCKSKGGGAMTGPLIALAADHAGFMLKNSMKEVLDEQSFPLVDLGPETADPVDYPDMAGKLAGALKDGRAQHGLLVCGTGIGIAIAANRYPWVRAAVCHDVTAARLAREHNDANVLALGARLIGPEVARDCLLTF
jgi:ribose 5-phosphate isomerase B